MLKKILNVVTHRVFIVSLLILLQIIFILSIVLDFNDYYVYYYVLSEILGILMTFYIIGGNSNPGYKIAWIVVLLIIPILGIIIYLIFGGNQPPASLSRLAAYPFPQEYLHIPFL